MLSYEDFDRIEDLELGIQIVDTADARVGEYQIGEYNHQYYWRWSLPGCLDCTEWYGPYDEIKEAQLEAIESAYDHGEDISFD